MDFLTGVLITIFSIGFFAYIIGLMSIYRNAFEKEGWWGVGILFLPVIWPIYILVDLKNTYKALLIQLGGLIFMGASIFLKHYINTFT
ncbi:MAG: hypothetical protein IEMM0008_0778 [bacterium]|nr:MAG: hypothetical protein IEMM0008_0778 [bacterium]